MPVSLNSLTDYSVPQTILSNATLTSDDFIVVSGNYAGLDVIISIQNNPSGHNPTIQFYVQDLDPGDGSTPIGTKTSGQVISQTISQVVAAPSSSGITKIGWTLSGASASFSGVSISAIPTRTKIVSVDAHIIQSNSTIDSNGSFIIDAKYINREVDIFINAGPSQGFKAGLQVTLSSVDPNTGALTKLSATPIMVGTTSSKLAAFSVDYTKFQVDWALTSHNMDTSFSGVYITGLVKTYLSAETSNVIDGIKITNAPTGSNQVLTTTSTTQANWQTGGGGGGGFTAGGDLSGTSTSQTVSNLQGSTLSAPVSSGSANKVLHGDSSGALNWSKVNLAADVTGTLPTGNQASQSMGGDVSGTTVSATVIKLQGNAVKSGANTIVQDGYVLTWVNSSNDWEAKPITSGPPSGSAGGDLSGTYPNPTVAKIQGKSLNASLATLGAAQDGYVLTWDNTDGYWKALPDTEAAAGITQLTGDVLAGPGSGSVVSTVTKISGSTPIIITPNEFQWIASAAPKIDQLQSITGNGSNFTIRAQDGYTAHPAVGGNLYLQSGFGTGGAVDGYTVINGDGVQFTRNNGSYFAQLGVSATSPQYGELWLSTTTPSNSNYALISDGYSFTNVNTISTGGIGLTVDGAGFLMFTFPNFAYFGGSDSTAPLHYDWNTSNVMKIIGGTGINSLNIGTNNVGATLSLQAGAASTQVTISTSSVTLASLAGSGSGYVAVNNSGVLSFVTGSAPSGSAGGDLSGNYPDPQVVQASGGQISFTPNIDWSGPIVSPMIVQDISTTGSGTSMTMRAQDGYLAHPSNGGNLFLSSGAKNSTGTDGYVALATAGNVRLTAQATGVITIANLGTGVVHADSSGNLTSSLIVNADIASAAAIAVSKLASGTASQVLINTTGGSPVPTWTTLSQDVTNSAGVMTVNSISGASPIAITPATLQWTQGTTGPTLNQAAGASNVVGQPLTIQAQNASGAAGGDGYFTSGTGTIAGTVHLQTGGVDQVKITPTTVTMHSLAGSGTGVVAVDNSGNLSFAAGSAPSGNAGGDLSGTYPNPTVAKLQGNAIINTALGSSQDGYVLTWVNADSQWEATDVWQQVLMSGKRLQYWSGGQEQNISGYYFGLNCAHQSVGTVSGNPMGSAPANMSLLGTTPRVRTSTASASGVNIGMYAGDMATSIPVGVWRGNAAGVGGFTNATRFGFDGVSASAQLFTFVGLNDGYGGAGPPTNINWTTQTTYNCAGFAFSLTASSSVFSGNWQFVTSKTGAGNVTSTDTGMAVTVGDVMEAYMQCQPNGSNISWRIKNITKNTSASGAQATNLPTSTVFMVWSSYAYIVAGGAATNYMSNMRTFMESTY